MVKFNVVQKRRRAAIAENKRQIHGNPVTKKLHQKQQPQSLSGKRKQKLLRKWRLEQKEAVEKGLISMEDVEMANSDDFAESHKRPVKFSMKKSAKLRLKKRDKKKMKKKQPNEEASTEAMME